ncbi:MAG TPA: UDP-3-O-(3-hydroxymyristoyl)glucosamine N-acyltransferase [Thermoanaerobaculia bacterium]|nr:UDP-3-O-(3-hydroxymyristoyl)glucosamine N-acyltransferase [Thermoanaerobaculia bacterium]
MPAVPISEIVALVGGRYSGPGDLLIRGVAPLADAAADQLAFLGNAAYAPQVAETKAGAVLVPDDFPGDDPRFIRVKVPHGALAEVLDRWFNTRRVAAGVSPLASIATSATIGRNVAVGAFTSVGEHAEIGDDTILYPNVTIYDGCKIGRRCILHSGVIVGSDGFGFVPEAGRHRKIPQIGIVRIEDDVEIGANTTVDRAALGETVIGEGTKIDNLVQIGHNVRIGRHCILVSQVGIAGSTQVGDHAVIAGQAGVAGHLTIGAGAQIGAAASVFHDVSAGEKVFGTPAVPFREWARRDVLLKRLLSKKRN